MIKNLFCSLYIENFFKNYNHIILFMDSKQVALLLAVITAASVIFTQVDLKPQVSEFESWKSQHGISFESAFENSYR